MPLDACFEMYPTLATRALLPKSCSILFVLDRRPFEAQVLYEEYGRNDRITQVQHTQKPLFISILDRLVQMQETQTCQLLDMKALYSRIRKSG